MFKNVFKTISQALAPAPRTEVRPVEKKPEPPPVASVRAFPTTAAKSVPVKPVARVEAAKSPEELCGVNAMMSKDDIHNKLAVLYKRYNRATSSLNTKLRAEAEAMLDAIVLVREKHFGPI